MARNTTLRRSFARSRIVEGRVDERRLDDAGDQRRFRQRQVADVLAEEDPRGLGDAVQRERAAVAEIDVVQIQLEDLVLGRLGLENQRHELLEDLAAVRALPRLLLG